MKIKYKKSESETGFKPVADFLHSTQLDVHRSPGSSTILQSPRSHGSIINIVTSASNTY